MKRGARNALGGRNALHGDGDEDDFGASFVLNRQDVDDALLGNGEDASPTDSCPTGFRERLTRMGRQLPPAAVALGLAVAAAAAVLLIAMVR